jgi:hypothetical protein
VTRNDFEAFHGGDEENRWRGGVRGMDAVEQGEELSAQTRMT